jgi:acetylornithine deacetylase
MTDEVESFIGELDTLLPDDELVKIASALIAIPSFTGQETPLAEHIANLLTINGIFAYHQEVEPGRFQVIGSLAPDRNKPALLFNGHLDMDPLGRDWTEDPYISRREGDKLYGAGLHNMKSGLAAILGAAIAVKRSHCDLRRPLLLEFVVGELQGGKGTQFALQSGLTAEVAVVPEPYSVKRIITRTAGVQKFAVVVRGVTAHTSRHEEGIDSIQVLRHVLDMFETTPLDLHSPDFPSLPRLQIASLIAGRGEHHDLSGVSYCADKATAIIDVRYPPPFEPTDVDRAIHTIIDATRKNHPEAQITVDHPPASEFRVGGTDMPPMDVPADSSVVKEVASLLPRVSNFSIEEIGLALPYSYCGNDTTHLSRAGIECCLFGPRGDDHDTEKHVLVSEMSACYRTLAALTILRCT